MTRLSNHSGQSETSFFFFLVIYTFSALNTNLMHLKVRKCTLFLHLKAEGLTYFFALRSLDPKLIGCTAEVESRTQGSRPRPRTQKKSEAKAKDSLSKDRHSRGQGHKAQVLSNKKKKRSSQKFFRRSPKKKKKKGLHKNFSSDLH